LTSDCAFPSEVVMDGIGFREIGTQPMAEARAKGNHDETLAIDVNQG